jgi:hypothetical protein
VGRNYGQKPGHFLEFSNNFFFVIGHNTPIWTAPLIVSHSRSLANINHRNQ